MDMLDFYLNNPVLRAGLFFIVGACLGSFVTALVYRIPRGEDWIAARSRCPECNHHLGAPDLIPILSWLYLRGKCRHCRAGVPLRYPLIELGGGVIALLVSLCF